MGEDRGRESQQLVRYRATLHSDVPLMTGSHEMRMTIEGEAVTYPLCSPGNGVIEIVIYLLNVRFGWL